MVAVDRPNARVVIAGFDLGLARYNRAKASAFQRAALEEAAHVPGVLSAAYGNSVPLSIDQSNSNVASEQAVDFNPKDWTSVSTYEVSPRYFETLGIRLLNGRDVTWQDDSSAPKVAVVNETFARNVFGTVDAVGRRFRSVGGGALTMVAGVVEDGKYVTLTERPRAAMFRPILQAHNSTTVLMVRTATGHPDLP